MSLMILDARSTGSLARCSNPLTSSRTISGIPPTSGRNDRATQGETLEDSDGKSLVDRADHADEGLASERGQRGEGLGAEPFDTLRFEGIRESFAEVFLDAARSGHCWCILGPARRTRDGRRGSVQYPCKRVDDEVPPLETVESSDEEHSSWVGSVNRQCSVAGPVGLGTTSASPSASP